MTLLIQILYNRGDSAHPCLTPLFVVMGSEIVPSINLMQFFLVLLIVSVSCVGML
jgi:hypothetical protein